MTRRPTIHDIWEEAYLAHGDAYDYSCPDYTDDFYEDDYSVHDHFPGRIFFAVNRQGALAWAQIVEEYDQLVTAFDVFLELHDNTGHDLTSWFAVDRVLDQAREFLAIAGADILPATLLAAWSISPKRI